MKHIIFTGKPNTGKSLFAKMIFGGRKTVVLSGRTFDVENNFFQFDLCKRIFIYDTLIIDDVKANFDFKSLDLISCHHEMIISRKNRDMEIIKTPRFVIITNHTEKIPTDNSFRSRFKIIDFDKNTIADLTKLIAEEKIIIELNH